MSARTDLKYYQQLKFEFDCHVNSLFNIALMIIE